MRGKIFSNKNTISRRKSDRGRWIALSLSLICIGAVSISSLTYFSYKDFQEAGAIVAEGVADMDYIGVNKSDANFVSVYDPRDLPYFEVNRENADKKISPPAAFSGNSFVVEPLRSIHFRENEIDWYAYVFPAGQGLRAANDLMPEEFFYGEWDGAYGVVSKYVYGDVVLFATAGEEIYDETMLAMATSLAPSCEVSQLNDYRGNDWLRNKAYAGDSYQELQVPIVVGAKENVLQEYTALPHIDLPQNKLLPEAIIKEINAKLNSPIKEVPYPAAAPQPPNTPTMTQQFGLFVPDEKGPGCGWNYTGAVSSASYGTPVKEMNEINQKNFDNFTNALTEDVSRYIKEYKDFASKADAWRKQKMAFLEFQKEVLSQYEAQFAQAISPILPSIASGEIYEQIEQWKEQQESIKRQREEEKRIAEQQAAQEKEAQEESQSS